MSQLVYLSLELKVDLLNVHLVLFEPKVLLLEVLLQLQKLLLPLFMALSQMICSHDLQFVVLL